MEIEELVEALDDMISAAPDGEKMVTVILFGVKYYKELDNISAVEVARRSAWLTASEGLEIGYGRRLGPYVVPRDATR